MFSKPKPFTIVNAWTQLNVVPDRWLKAKDEELPDGVHSSRKVNLQQLRSSYGAPKGDEAIKARIRAAYAANDRLAARKAWGELLTSVYPVLAQPAPASGFSLR